MKKKLKLLFLAILLGLGLSYITYKKFEISESTIKVLAYQVGVYKEYENALTKAKSLKGSIILKKQDNYQVIAAISKNNSNTKKIEEMLNEENVSFYKKELSLNKDALEPLDYYELAMEQVENKDTLSLLNQKLLEEIQERMK